MTSAVKIAVNGLLDCYEPEEIIRAVADHLQARADDADEQGDGSAGYIEAANRKDEAINAVYEAATKVEEAF